MRRGGSASSRSKERVKCVSQADTAGFGRPQHHPCRSSVGQAWRVEIDADDTRSIRAIVKDVCSRTLATNLGEAICTVCVELACGANQHHMSERCKAAAAPTERRAIRKQASSEERERWASNLDPVHGASAAAIGPSIEQRNVTKRGCRLPPGQRIDASLGLCSNSGKVDHAQRATHSALAADSTHE